jgi:hypothetical protein
MPTKAETQDRAQKLATAIRELNINVPIYQVRALPTGGLRLWLYGHHAPVDWTPPDHAPASAPSRRPSRRKRSTT